MFSILKTSLTEKPLILQGEVWLGSLLGLKGLMMKKAVWFEFGRPYYTPSEAELLFVRNKGYNLTKFFG